MRLSVKATLVLLAGLIACGVVVVVAWQGAETLLRQSARLPQPIAQLSDCKGRKFDCYYQYLRPRTINDGPTVALTAIKQAYTTDPYVAAQCHELVHVVGVAAAERFRNLPAVLRYDDPMCDGGYKHGAEEALARQQGSTE